MSEQSFDPGQGKNYWRSLQELADSESFRVQVENEFPAGIEAPTDGVSRRHFLQIMAASVAMAGVAGCRWPEEKIVPFSHRPAGTVPGVAKQFATATEIAGVASSLLVTSYDGRPIKVDGNPDHALTQGAASALLQATVLDLYDPDRSRGVMRYQDHQRVAATWDDFLAFAAERRAALAASGGAGLAVLAEASSSPSRRALQQEMRRAYPRMQWYEHEPTFSGHEAAGTRMALGHACQVLPDLERARVIVGFDADLLQEHPTALRNARGFARGRRPDAAMNRLYVFEPTPTVTGGMADHRFPLPASRVRDAAFALAAELILNQGLQLPGGSGPTAIELRPFLGAAGHDEAMRALASDLLAHRGEALLAAGPRQPAEVHALCAVLNAALGGAGRTVNYVPVDREMGELAGRLPELVAALDGGRVETLIMLGGNPVATAPAGVEIVASLEKARHSVHLSGHRNATSRRCTWHVNRAHYLESWGDLRAPDGSHLAVQPLIAPLYDGKSDLELLSALLDETPRKGHDIARSTFHRRTGGRGEVPANNPRFEKRWRTHIHDGQLADSATPPETPTAVAVGRWSLAAPTAAAGSAEDLELVILASPQLHDGRFANNAWLQELPDFATKLTWDNAALLGPATAEALGVTDGDVVALEWRGHELELPVSVLPGQAAWCVTAYLGYGREDAGRVGDGVGGDVYRLRVTDAPHGGRGLRVRPTGGRHPLATTQDHHAIDPLGYQERERRVGGLVREASLEHYLEHPDFVDHLGIHHPPLKSLWKDWEYTGHKWGMSIDLNVCTGCNACVAACQAENNIPVVGKDEVSRGREMHWIRLDRYFKGDPEAPEIAQQPVACVHCETAPCEGVCPVAATVHTEEGLNAMVYNRCVGTRYCSNNCPYKVRRFNWFDNQGAMTATEKMVQNPEVTVRSRGVMEKCTYCVQRIETARIQAKNERRPLQDGDIVPACQQTCPTEAIVFGDLNDPESRVAKLREEKRSYDLLAYLNVRPRTSYQGRIRNPHPALAPAVHDDGQGGDHGEGHDVYPDEDQGGDHDDGHGSDHG